MPSTPSFRKQGIFATYANVHLLEEELSDLPTAFWEFYQEMFLGKIANLAIAVEPYAETEGHHAHVLCHFNEPHRYNMESITFRGNRPNVSTSAKWYAKSLQRLVDYVKKGTNPDLIRSDFPAVESCGNTSRRLDTFRRSVNASSRLEAENVLKEEAPDIYIKSFSNVQSFLTSNFSGVSNEYTTPVGYQFDVPDEVERWVDTQFDPEVSYVGGLWFFRIWTGDASASYTRP